MAKMKVGLVIGSVTPRHVRCLEPSRSYLYPVLPPGKSRRRGAIALPGERPAVASELRYGLYNPKYVHPKWEPRFPLNSLEAASPPHHGPVLKITAWRSSGRG